METYKVNKAGEPQWINEKARTPKEAIEKHFRISVYHFSTRYRTFIFDDLNEDQLYGAKLVKEKG